jgi:dihydrolipoamide dehydrogenase
MSERYDIAVLGGGPGGYVAAIRAAQLGYKTVVIDKDNLGGICLNWGCIPTKSLLKNAELYDSMKHHAKEFGITCNDLSFDFTAIIKRSRDISAKISQNVELLMKKNKIDRVRGFGMLTDNHTINVSDEKQNTTRTIQAEKIIIAAGASPRIFPQIPVDRKHIITSSEAMTLESLPEELIIIGAGAIGIEFAYFYSVLGSKVTVIEALDRILPIEDEEISAQLQRQFKKRGIAVYSKAKVEKAEVNGNKVTVIFEQGGKAISLTADKVLSAVGVTGNITGYGLEQLGVEIEKNHIKVDRKTYQTNIDSIYAIGDVIGPPWLAHVASAEGMACVEGIKGLKTSGVDYGSIPGCTYCQPQVASIGLTEKKAVEAGYKIKVGKFPFMASGKAFAIGERDGFVKLVFDEKYGELLGAHIIGSEATEMIAELGIAKALGATAETIFKTIHAHPTLAESVMEASAQAYGEAIHI